MVRAGNDPLAALRWHWGEAYTIANPEPDVWLAVRHDDHTTLRDTTPTGLRDRILADYSARPVPRQDGVTPEATFCLCCLGATNYERYSDGMHKTSVKLPDDLWQQWKAARVPLREAVRLGLAAINGGTPAPGPAPDGGTTPEPPADLAVSGDWITVQEAADALSISASRVHHLLSVGYLESRKADDGWRRMVSAASVRAELDRRKRAARGVQGPYADAASTYQAETEAAYRAVVARHTPEEVNHDDDA